MTGWSLHGTSVSSKTEPMPHTLNWQKSDKITKLKAISILAVTVCPACSASSLGRAIGPDMPWTPKCHFLFSPSHQRNLAGIEAWSLCVHVRVRYVCDSCLETTFVVLSGTSTAANCSAQACDVWKGHLSVCLLDSLAKWKRKREIERM